MSCLVVILNNRHPENTYNILFNNIIVAHLNSGAIVRQCIVNYPYCDISLLLYMKLSLISSYRDKFLVNIEV